MDRIRVKECQLRELIREVLLEGISNISEEKAETIEPGLVLPTFKATDVSLTKHIPTWMNKDKFWLGHRSILEYLNDMAAEDPDVAATLGQKNPKTIIRTVYNNLPQIKCDYDYYWSGYQLQEGPLNIVTRNGNFDIRFKCEDTPWMPPIYMGDLLDSAMAIGSIPGIVEYIVGKLREGIENFKYGRAADIEVDSIDPRKRPSDEERRTARHTI